MRESRWYGSLMRSRKLAAQAMFTSEEVRSAFRSVGKSSVAAEKTAAQLQCGPVSDLRRLFRVGLSFGKKMCDDCHRQLFNRRLFK